MKQKISIVVSSIGYHWEELVAAYLIFTRAGLDSHFFTTTGRPPKADPASLIPEKYLSKFGIGSPPEISPDSPFGKNFIARLNTARSVLELNPKEYVGIYLPGGHGCLFDVNTSTTLHSRLLEFYQTGKPLGAVCHATSTFAFVKEREFPITEGKSLTGFPDFLDNLLLTANAIDKSFLPIPFSNEGKLRASGAKNDLLDQVLAVINPKHHVVDHPFYTGVGPKAAALVAKAMIQYIQGVFHA